MDCRLWHSSEQGVTAAHKTVHDQAEHPQPNIVLAVGLSNLVLAKHASFFVGSLVRDLTHPQELCAAASSCIAVSPYRAAKLKSCILSDLLKSGLCPCHYPASTPHQPSFGKNCRRRGRGRVANAPVLQDRGNNNFAEGAQNSWMIITLGNEGDKQGMYLIVLQDCPLVDQSESREGGGFLCKRLK
jgi:hypothetical protein